KSGGTVVIETPNIQSIPYRLLQSRWRQFIPEHYFFFDRQTITKLMEIGGLRVKQIINIGKYASLDLILNHLSRYTSLARAVNSAAHGLGMSRLTFRIDPRDIMLVIAVRA